MKFIFPKNYKYNAKILGFIDYTTAIIDVMIGMIIFLIIHIFIKKISTQIYVFVIIYIPVILFSILGTGGENIINYCIYILKFIKNRRVYFYIKEGNRLSIKNNDKSKRKFISVFENIRELCYETFLKNK